jgi:hypothetical protein
MTNPRDILNELKWREDKDLENAEIWYVHRGALNDTKIISGKEIVKIGRSFMHTKSGMIPFHRIFKIICEKSIIFERK